MGGKGECQGRREAGGEHWLGHGRKGRSHGGWVRGRSAGWGHSSRARGCMRSLLPAQRKGGKESASLQGRRSRERRQDLRKTPKSVGSEGARHGVDVGVADSFHLEELPRSDLSSLFLPSTMALGATGTRRRPPAPRWGPIRATTVLLGQALPWPCVAPMPHQRSRQKLFL